MCGSSWGHKWLGMTEQVNNDDIKSSGEWKVEGQDGQIGCLTYCHSAYMRAPKRGDVRT